MYTPKQLSLMKTWQRKRLKRLNLLEGSVSSGKTWISLVLWAFMVATMPQDKLYLMCAKSLTTLKRNCLLPLEELIGSNNFKFSLAAKEGYIFGRHILFEGANDARSEAKIRGLTIQAAYCDELTLFPEDFFAMLLSRLRLPNAKLIATTNPDTPRHWLKTKYIDRAEELDMLAVKFLLDDNTMLDAAYVENIKREYTGVFYDRYILGQWKTAEGAIYHQFADTPNKFIVHSSNDALFATIGLDFGGNGSAHAAVCTGFSRSLGKVVVLDEYYRKEVITPAELDDDICDFILRNQSKYKIADLYADSAEQVLINGLKAAVAKRKIPINIHNARKGEITDRIRFTNAVISQGRFFVLKHCKHIIQAFQDAVWDSKAYHDKRLDNGTTNIDSLDAFEYSVEPYISKIIKMR